MLQHDIEQRYVALATKIDCFYLFRFVRPVFVQPVLVQSFSSNPVFVQSCFRPFGFRPWPIFVQIVFVQTVNWSKTKNTVF